MKWKVFFDILSNKISPFNKREKFEKTRHVKNNAKLKNTKPEINNQQI